jgi:predicted alpha-1,2-mannosidase
MSKISATALLLLLTFVIPIKGNGMWQYVDPMIGSEGEGRVFIGPSAPFGMIKPGPDCTCKPNSGWLPVPEVVTGFSQTHVSGTGGGPKYGNILLQPFSENDNSTDYQFHRSVETVRLGYYSTTYQENDIKTEITSAERASIYRFTYPSKSSKRLSVNAGFFLGEDSLPNAREAQQFIGSEIEIVSDNEVRGYTRIRGGWNNGNAYTVFFCLISDTPFTQSLTWKGSKFSDSNFQYDEGKKTGAILTFDGETDVVRVKIGISFVSELKARENAAAEIDHFDFDKQMSKLRAQWDSLLCRIEIDKNTDIKYKRMFYTALYHTMLEPVNRTGDNPLWENDGPYYDDFYAIWDTYRTSLPLITLIDESREREIVNSLINIYQHDGYMPDARSGNCNGRTQGGSNAEMVVADAYMKGIGGIDYEQGLKAMLKDATVSPSDAEKEGRGGLTEYNHLGYVPYGIDRAGNRTVEYSFNDFCIGEVASGLGYHDIATKYFEKSQNWKNLWRSDYQYDGVRGFIMPRSSRGEWLDSIVFGESKIQQPKFVYTPVTREAPWYNWWWGTFFYEATSWEYSLSIPHDVDGLIEKCGGKDEFRKRLDRFFDGNYYNVGNEPSFLTPCLYHWIGRPDLSSNRIKMIVNSFYNDSRKGIPGNDDSGAMSSWLAFHLIGIYPLAGTDKYLIHKPLLNSTTLHLSNGKQLVVINGKKSGIYYNGALLDSAFITHQMIMNGGLLEIGDLGCHKEKQESTKKTNRDGSASDESTVACRADVKWTLRLNTIQHEQKRNYDIALDDTVVYWRILRNGKWQSGRYVMTNDALQNADRLCWQQPFDGKTLILDNHETWLYISNSAYRELQEKGSFVYNFTSYHKISACNDVIYVKSDVDSTEMSIGSNRMILSMKNNPLGIDWQIN